MTTVGEHDMESRSFDRLTRRLAVTTSRRGGIAAIVAGALGIAGISTTEAVVPIPPTCLATNAICTDGAQCCSGRCIAKRLKNGGGSRCARKTSNRKPKKEDACIAINGVCSGKDQCCPSGNSEVSCKGDGTNADVCCLDLGSSCELDTDCCGYWDTISCVDGVCSEQ